MAEGLPAKLALEIVTPDRALVRAAVDEVVVPGERGYFGVLPGHTPFLSTLGVGELMYRQERESRYLAVAFGFAEVLPERVTVLAEVAERAEEIDLARAQAARARAERRLKEQAEEHEFRRTQVKLEKAVARIQVAGKAQAPRD